MPKGDACMYFLDLSTVLNGVHFCGTFFLNAYVERKTNTRKPMVYQGQALTSRSYTVLVT